MPLWSSKPSTPKVAKGRCPSLTVLFFANRECFLPEDVKDQALAMGLTAVTARYVEPSPNTWVLKVMFHRGRTKRTKSTLPLRETVEPSYESAAAILVGEVRHAYRQFKAHQEDPAVEVQRS